MLVSAVNHVDAKLGNVLEKKVSNEDFRTFEALFQFLKEIVIGEQDFFEIGKETSLLALTQQPLRTRYIHLEVSE